MTKAAYFRVTFQDTIGPFPGIKGKKMEIVERKIFEVISVGKKIICSFRKNLLILVQVAPRNLFFFLLLFLSVSILLKLPLSLSAYLSIPRLFTKDYALVLEV